MNPQKQKTHQAFRRYWKQNFPKREIPPFEKESEGTRFLSDALLMFKTIRKGIPVSLFQTIKESAPFSDMEWADLLNISTKSLQRYQNDPTHVFKPIHSEKIMEMTEVSLLGQDVFDTPEQFAEWLKTPSLALGKMKPTELLKNSYGKEMVVDELHCIDHGIFA